MVKVTGWEAVTAAPFLSYRRPCWVSVRGTAAIADASKNKRHAPRARRGVDQREQSFIGCSFTRHESRGTMYGVGGGRRRCSLSAEAPPPVYRGAEMGTMRETT